jgi:hypothetical protein
MENLEKRIIKLESENKLIKSILQETLKNSLIGNMGLPLCIKDEIKDLIGLLNKED